MIVFQVNEEILIIRSWRGMKEQNTRSYGILSNTQNFYNP